MASGTKIFVNLPVRELERSKSFFGALGYGFDPRFTDEKAACLVIAEGIYAMLLTEPFFKTFTRKELVDATRATEVIVALSMAGRKEVDELFAKAMAAGAKPSLEPYDLGWMYGTSFQDLDGHIWEIFWMDEAAAAKAQEAATAQLPGGASCAEAKTCLAPRAKPAGGR